MKKTLLEVKKLAVFKDSEGRLFETLRVDDALFRGEFGQNLVSFVKYGVIKGLHLHHKTTEYTTCIQGKILYAAIKEGEKPIIEKIILDSEEPLLIRTDPEIWHGFTPLTKNGAMVLYTMNLPYNPKDTDIEDKYPYAFGNIWK